MLVPVCKNNHYGTMKFLLSIVPFFRVRKSNKTEIVKYSFWFLFCKDLDKEKWDFFPIKFQLVIFSLNVQLMSYEKDCRRVAFCIYFSKLMLNDSFSNDPNIINLS